MRNSRERNFKKILYFKLTKFFLTLNMFKIASVIAVIFLICIFSFYQFEKDAALKDFPTITEKVGISFWWAIVTSSTVGYGDYYPQTNGGRFLAVVIMIIGISIFGILTASLTTFIVELRRRWDKGMNMVEMENHIVVCGWNSYAESIVEILVNNNEEVVILADLDERPYEHNDVQFVKGDSTNLKDLKKSDMERAKIAIILADLSGNKSYAGADSHTVLSVLNIESYCKSKGNDIYTCAELVNKENEIHLINADADEIVIHGLFSSGLLSKAATHPGSARVLHSIVTNDFGKEMSKIRLSDLKGFDEGISFRDLMIELKKSRNMIAIAVEKDDREMFVNPENDMKIMNNDSIFVIKNC